MKKYLFGSFSSFCAFIASIAIFCGFIIEAGVLLIVNVLNKLLQLIFKSYSAKSSLQSFYINQSRQSI